MTALLVAGVDPDDLPDPKRADEALDAVGFLVSLELRPSAVTARADVVLPVAAVPEKDGTYLNWEGRARPFERALKPDQMVTRHLLPDVRVLSMIADVMAEAGDGDCRIGLPDVAAARRELTRFGAWDHDFAAAPTQPGRPLPQPGHGEAVLAGHRMLLDLGSLQEGEEPLAGTRHESVARLSPATAAEIGASDGAPLYVSGPNGTVTLPLRTTAMPDRVVWLPLHSTGAGLSRDLGAAPGRLVQLSSQEPSAPPTAPPTAPSNGQPPGTGAADDAEQEH